MVSKVFLDANIILDATLNRTGSEDAKAILEAAINQQIIAFITPSIVHICSYFLTKEYGSKWVKEFFLSMMEYVRVIDTNHRTVVLSLQSGMKDIEDAMQYYTAIDHKMDVFISGDKVFSNNALILLPIVSAQKFRETYLQ